MYSVHGYIDKMSYFNGDTIGVKILSLDTVKSINIYNMLTTNLVYKHDVNTIFDQKRDLYYISDIPLYTFVSRQNVSFRMTTINSATLTALQTTSTPGISIRDVQLKRNVEYIFSADVDYTKGAPFLFIQEGVKSVMRQTLVKGKNEIKFVFNSDELFTISVLFGRPEKQTIVSLKNYSLKTSEPANVHLHDMQMYKKGCCLYRNGYKYKISYNIHAYFPKGLYSIELKTDNSTFNIPFIIKADSSNKSNNLILMNTNTWQAYDYTGGSSLYKYCLPIKTKYSSVDNTSYPIQDKKTCVTFDRPLSLISEGIDFYFKNLDKNVPYRNHLIRGEMELLVFMFKNEIEFDLCDDMDIEKNTIDLTSYKNLILNCHPEYWTNNMFENITLNAPNIISFAGNVGYRQTLIVGTQIFGRIGYTPQKNLEKITGSYYTAAGLNTYAPYKIYVKDSLFFKGINNDVVGTETLSRVDELATPFTKICGNSGHELDKKIPSVDAHVLAKGMNPSGSGGDMIYFVTTKHDKTKRHIFSVGSVAYTSSLKLDTDIATLTLNVLNYFKNLHTT
jgi:hypothetical protein